MNVGFHFVPRPGIWYLFHREYTFGPQPSYCKADYARILVRNSTDQGRTWSNGSVVATPIPNTAQECAIVDGAGFFDEETGTWHYIGQCLNRTNHWMLCHYTRQAPTPTGSFVPNPHNPVREASGPIGCPCCRYHQGGQNHSEHAANKQTDASQFYFRWCTAVSFGIGSAPCLAPTVIRTCMMRVSLLPAYMHVCV